MRKAILVAAVVLAAVSVSARAEWKTYSVPENHFRADFPEEPKSGKPTEGSIMYYAWLERPGQNIRLGVHFTPGDPVTGSLDAYWKELMDSVVASFDGEVTSSERITFVDHPAMRVTVNTNGGEKGEGVFLLVPDKGWLFGLYTMSPDGVPPADVVERFRKSFALIER